MNEIIDEYGSIICESLVAGMILVLLYFAMATGAAALDADGLNGASGQKSLPSYIEDAQRECPELTVRKELVVSPEDEIDLKELIVSAFGRKQFEINVLTEAECQSIASIRDSLKGGCVNVAYYHDIKEKKGNYRLVMYAKDSGRFGQWAEAECRIVFKDTEQEDTE